MYVLEITFTFATFHAARRFTVDNTGRAFRRYSRQGFFNNFIQGGRIGLGAARQRIAT